MAAPCRVLSLVLLSLLLSVSGVRSRVGRHGHSDVPDFEAIRTLEDGERERWVHVGGVYSRETAVTAVQGGRQRSVKLWQATKGRHFIQSIYDADRQLRDCEILHEAEHANHFLAAFDGLVARARALVERHEHKGLADGGNAFNDTLRLIEGGRKKLDDDELAHLTDYRRLRDECRRLHRTIRRLANEQLAAQNNSLRASSDDDDDDQQQHLTRLKRDLFMYPGTNWCGIGATTDRYTELGFNAAADRCCRQHDHCRHIIPGFSTKYNLFNYRFHTISHCDCDERFRTCLKMVNNGAANMVGKLFFNIVQLRCFVLKGEKVCSKRSWWGRCLKYKKQKTARLKDALPF